MSRSDPQVNFRMPAELKAKLEAAAAENRRSTTAEIVARLEASFGARPEIIAIDEAHPANPAQSDQLYQVSRSELHSLVFEAINSSIDSVLGKTEKSPAIPTKGPAPRGKHRKS